MKVLIQTYTLILILFVTTALFGQSKDCGNPVYYNGTPATKCYITPTKTIGDTIVSYIPKNCNQFLFDSTANGHWKVYSNDSTTLTEITNIAYGHRNGQSISYYSNGQIKAKLYYKDGKLQGDAFLYTITGKIIEKGYYDIYETFHGITYQYWDNGNIASEETIHNGWIITKATYWNKDGKIISEKKFKKLWCNKN